MKSGTKYLIFGIVKLAVFVLLAVFVISLADRGKMSATPLSEMAQQVTAAADLSTMTEGDNQMVRRLYGLDPADYEGIVLYYPADSMDAYELCIVKLSDLSQQQAVLDALQARVDSQISVFESYAPESTALLQNCALRAEGNYVLLIVADDTAPVVQAFTDGL